MNTRTRTDAREASKVTRVAAGIIRDPQGRILVSRRPADKHLGGLWEFPGGKCDRGESAHAALVRELDEELGIAVVTARPWLSLTHHYPEKIIRLMLFTVERWQGRVHGREHQPVDWVAPERLTALDMPPADRPILRMLTLDPRYAISPDPEQAGGIDGVIAWWRDRLAAGYRLLQLRAHSLDVADLHGLAGDCGRLAREYGARWLLNGPADLADAAGADGLHLSAGRLIADIRRPLADDRLVAASCHDGRELAAARRLGVDFVTLSPVRPTASHAHAGGLGWARFGELAAEAPAPVFALGGVGPDDLETARGHGAFGVAGIRAFSR